jgi:hypothetical protein
MILYNNRGEKVVVKNFQEGIEITEDGKPVHFQP